MGSPLEAFRVTDRTKFDTDFWERFRKTLIAEIEAIKAAKVDYDSAVRALSETGLARINEVLAPAYAEIQELAHLGAIFTARSEAGVGLAIGQTEWVVVEAERDRFAPSGYLWVTSADGNKVAAGWLVSYARDTGIVRIDVEYIDGDGVADDWTLTIGLPPSLSVVDGGTFS